MGKKKALVTQHWPVRKLCRHHCWGQWVETGCGYVDCEALHPCSHCLLRRQSQKPAETLPTACRLSRRQAENLQQVVPASLQEALLWRSLSHHHQVSAVDHAQTTKLQTITAYIHIAHIRLSPLQKICTSDLMLCSGCRLFGILKSLPESRSRSGVLI